VTATTFIKHYDDPRRAAAARAHHTWLASLDSGVRLPALLAATPHSLEFEHLGDRHPGPDELPALAAALGRLHAAAHTSQLHAAQLDIPFTTTGDLTIPDFATPRRATLEQMPLPTAGLPAAIYKDANIRNFILTDDGPAIVDFDDLTLAPFGYDLAKLIVSTAMTHDQLGPRAVARALETYNTQTAVDRGNRACTLRYLQGYAELHNLYTARYLHQNGYRHPWPDVRPWRSPRWTTGPVKTRRV
jgi:Phosphotransferase enzyme family